MKVTRLCTALSFGLASAGAAAQGTGDAMDKLRACSLLVQAERVECLEKLSRDIAPAPPPAAAPAAQAPAAEDWTVSETTSPFDYSPVATATALSRGTPGSVAMQLSIQCRGGRTELVIGGTDPARRAEDHVVSYAINDGPPVVQAAGTPASGKGVAVAGDVVRLLASLPDRGDVVFRVDARKGGAALEGRYSLSSLKIVRDRLAAACRWPALKAPRN